MTKPFGTTETTDEDQQTIFDADSAETERPA